MLNIGPYCIKSAAVLAPMAGITDRPFRQLCRKLGAGLAASECVTAQHKLWHTKKSMQRLDLQDEISPKVIQIVGSDPDMLAQSACLSARMGAQIVDINMGCPAKKVCNKAAGSALLRDEKQVEHILRTVVSAVDIPVTLKIRTGWDPNQRNGVHIAQIAEQCGIQALSVHGRTRQCFFKGQAEYQTIADIKKSVNIPIIANGDIDSPLKAQQVLSITRADAVMIGRAAQGQPWIFEQISQFLQSGNLPKPMPIARIHEILLKHLRHLYQFYGESSGVRIARKHIGWYVKRLIGTSPWYRQLNVLETCQAQYDCINQLFERLIHTEDMAK